MYKVIAVIDKLTCINCATVDGMVFDEPGLPHVCGNVECRCVVEEVWLCDWCKDYGKSPISRCYHPMTETPIKTNKNENICHGCAKTYAEGKRLLALIREKTKEYEAMKCKCNGFHLQYDGCSCEKGILKKYIKELTEELINECKEKKMG
jgi:hypothetical protein